MLAVFEEISPFVVPLNFLYYLNLATYNFLYKIFISNAVPAHLLHMWKTVATIVLNPVLRIFLYESIIFNAVPAQLLHMWKTVVTILLITFIWPLIIFFMNLMLYCTIS